MKVKIALFTILSLWGLVSCYEDKGNYDYREMNDIEVSVSTENTSYLLGDEVISKPELTFALGHESEDLAYEWTYDGHPIAYTRDLNWVADTIAQNKELRLAVLDKSTGVTYFGSTTISISSAYKGDGWIVLSEKDGKSMLTFMRRATENGALKPVVTRDIYRMINGEELGGKPLSVCPHWTDRWDGEDPEISWLWVAQEGGLGAVDVSGSSYQREGLLSEMFLEGYPGGFVPQSVIDMQALTLAIGTDGTVYTRVKENNLLFNTSRFLNTPLTSDGKGERKVDGSMIAYAPFAAQGGMLLYDKNSSQFLHVTDKMYNGEIFNSGKVLPLNVSEDTYISHPDYARLNNMEGYTVHFVGAYKSDMYWGQMPYITVIENDATHEFYIQRFVVNGFTGSFSTTSLGTSYDAQTAAPELAQVIDGTSELHYSLFRYQESAWQYLFIGKGNDLWLYYLKENRLFKCATFASPITSVDTEYYNNQYLIVGLESGDVFILKGYTSDTSDENTIDRVVINQGQTLQITEADGEIVLWHEKELGQIKQVRYKPNTGNGWDDEFDYYY